MTTYILGTDTFTDEFPELDDGVAEQASNWNPALEALANRTRFLLNRVLLGPGINWHAAVGTTHNLERGAWSTKEQTWYGVGHGGNDFLERSQDSGRTWVDLTAALGGGGLAVMDVGVDDAGNLLLVNQGSRNVYYGAYGGYGFASSGGSWTNVPNALTAAPSGARVAWESGAGVFIVVYRVGATGFRVDTAPTSTFTAQAIPAKWTAYAGSNDAEIGVGNGRALATFFDDSGAELKQRVMRTTNGGVAWTESTFVPTLTGNPAWWSRPTYNTLRDEWYILVSRGAPVGTELWRSTDGGATWAKVGGFALEAHSLAALGDLLICVLADGREAYSLNRGVTWKLGNRSPQTSAVKLTVCVGGGGFVFWNSGDKTSFATSRVGDVGSVIT